MERIASFCVNHDLLTPGMYTSRVDGDVTTYDVRMFVPNAGVYLSPAGAHTLEHLLATKARNSAYADHVIYVGPMGCLTGFYFLVRDLSPEDSIALVQECMMFAAGFEGEIPGASRVECGNYVMNDLIAAKRVAARMCGVLEGWTPEQMTYRTE